MTDPAIWKHIRWRDLRHACDLSLRELELRSGINRGRLSIIERGVTPTADEAARILAILKPPQ